MKTLSRPILLSLVTALACSTSGTIQTVTSTATTSGAVTSISGTTTTSSNTAATTMGHSSTGSTATHGSTTAGSATSTGHTSSSGSGTTTAAASSTGGATTGASSTTSGFVAAPAFYVAPNGSDTNPGTLAQPFATLAQAQIGMRGSGSVKTTYVRAGTYTPPAGSGTCVWGNGQASISLTSADSGETWSYYPPDGLGSAIIDGQSTLGNSGGTGGNGIGCAFGADYASNVTIVGLQFQNFLYAAFWGHAADGFTFTGNEVHHTTAAANNSGAVVVVASPGATISHNYLHDLAYMGAVMSDNSADGGNMGNGTIESNVVINACTYPAAPGGNDQNGGDCGAIYLVSTTTTISTNLSVLNNDVRDVNVSSNGTGDFGSCCAQGIYLDDGINNVLVSGNVVSGITTSCFMIHGGRSNVITGNLCDLGTLPNTAIVTYQLDGDTQMTGNVFSHNVVVAASSMGGGGFLGSSPPNPMTISHNDYFSYSSTALVTTDNGSGAGTDSSPVSVDPGVSCWGPTLNATSPVLGAPVSFPGLSGNWRPPGFVIPQTGSAPSWPHGC